jgi:hypothetical protein
MELAGRIVVSDERAFVTRRRCVVALAVVGCTFTWLTGADAGADAAAPTAPTAPQGNVTPNFQPATNEVAAVANSAPVDGRIGVLLQNGTSSPARVEAVVVTAARADGGQTSRARSIAAYPQVLAPGELALAAVQFRPRDVAPGASFTVNVRTTPVSSARVTRGLGASNLVLSAPKTGRVAQTLRATLTNVSTSWTARRPDAAVMCFGEAGTPTTFAHARASARRIAPGKAALVSVPLTSLCPSYLVAARAA